MLLLGGGGMLKQNVILDFVQESFNGCIDESASESGEDQNWHRCGITNGGWCDVLFRALGT